MKVPKTPSKPSKYQNKGNVNSRTNIFNFRFPNKEHQTARQTSSIDGFNLPLAGGYPAQFIIGLVGVPKAGKTTLAIQEVLGSLLKDKSGEALIIFNESNREFYLDQIVMNAKALGYSTKDFDALKRQLTLLDLNGNTVSGAGTSTIQGYGKNKVMNPVRNWMETHRKAKYIVFDTFTKMINQFPAQVYILMQEIVEEFQAYFQDDKNKDLKVVVIMIHQKSDLSRRGEAIPFGGPRILHEMDGNIIIGKEDNIDGWTAKALGLPQFSSFRYIRVDLRGLNVDTEARIYGMRKGKVFVGKKLTDLMRNATEED